MGLWVSALMALVALTVFPSSQLFAQRKEVRKVEDADLKAEIYSYSRSKGFFAGITLAGASLEIDDDANASYYGKADLVPRTS
jgi:TRAP-type C4-dicarboxylate transport system substrate-binding protein